MKLYKVLYIDSLMTPRDVFREIDIFDEQGLRLWFIDRICSDGFNDDTLEHFGLDSNTDDKKFSVKEILNIFRYDGFETDVIEIEDDNQKDEQ